MKIGRRYFFLAALAGAVVTLDQLTKMYIHTQFYLGETVPLLEDFFNLTYVRNTGAAFGIFRDAPESFRDIFFSVDATPRHSCYSFYFMECRGSRSSPNLRSQQYFWRSHRQLHRSPSIWLCYRFSRFAL
jgi:lipoprotein signal peptidase